MDVVKAVCVCVCIFNRKFVHTKGQIGSKFYKTSLDVEAVVVVVVVVWWCGGGGGWWWWWVVVV